MTKERQQKIEFVRTLC